MESEGPLNCVGHLVDGGGARAKPRARREEGANPAWRRGLIQHSVSFAMALVKLIGLYEAGAALLFLSPLKIGKMCARRKEAGA